MNWHADCNSASLLVVNVLFISLEVFVKNRPYAIAFLLLISSTPSIRCEQDWLGKTVLFKDSAHEIIGKEIADKYKVVGFPTQVGDGRGEWPWIANARIKKSDVVIPQPALRNLDFEIGRGCNIAPFSLNPAMAQRLEGELKESSMDFDDVSMLDPSLTKALCNQGVFKAYPTINKQQGKPQNESGYAHFIVEYQLVDEDSFG